MSHQEPNQEFAPALQPDFTNQDHVFIVLEELGIAYMQNAWVERNSPDHADAKAVKAQSEEFREDVVSLLTGKAEKSRYVDNGWVGAKLSQHLKKVFGDEVGSADASDEEVIRRAVAMFQADLDVLMAHEEHEAMLGRKLEPKEYIDLMVAWSGVFSGVRESLSLPTPFLIFKAQAHAHIV